jgi:calcium-dependent protein kinase
LLEVEILAKLSHPNIMSVYEFYHDNSNFYIVSEYCSGGELFDCITEKGSFNEIDAAKIMKQIISAICYSHDNNIVHRDLKPENILLDDKSNKYILKIIDWGGARYFSNNKKMSSISGTPYYIAPEVLNEIYDEKCDIWSCGVILYILLCGYPPFNGDSDNDIMKAVKKGKFSFPSEDWNTVSKEAKDLITHMLTIDTKKRYSAKDSLAHSWFKKKDFCDKSTGQNVIKNMVKFKTDRKFEQATINFIVTQLISKEERNKLLDQFQSWDSNSDGVLSRDEIYDGYKSLYGEVVANEEVVKIVYLGFDYEVD